MPTPLSHPSQYVDILFFIRHSMPTALFHPSQYVDILFFIRHSMPTALFHPSQYVDILFSSVTVCRHPYLIRHSMLTPWNKTKNIRKTVTSTDSVICAGYMGFRPKKTNPQMHLQSCAETKLMIWKECMWHTTCCT